MERYKRKYLYRLVPLENFTLAHIPTEQVRRLFGGAIDERFFAVAVTIRNSSDSDQLVGLGMIRAVGRALVGTGDRKERREARHNRFTVPVESAPQSLERVHAVLLGEASRRGRSVTFRALTFVGALATAAATFGGLPGDYEKGVSVFTGIFIPELDRAWVDQHPSHLRNLVAFAMQDLTKVPANSASPTRVLFFPRSNIEGMVLDTSFFGTHNVEEWNGILRDDRGFEPPHVHIVRMEFEALEIPFEDNTTTAGTDARDDVLSQLARIRGVLTGLALLPRRPDGGLAVPLAATSELIGELPELVRPALTTLRALVNDWDVDVGTQQCRELRDELVKLEEEIISGQEVEVAAGQVQDRDSECRNAERELQFYRDAITFLGSLSEQSSEERIKKKLSTMIETATASPTPAAFSKTLAKLREHVRAWAAGDDSEEGGREEG